MVVGIGDGGVDIRLERLELDVDRLGGIPGPGEGVGDDDGDRLADMHGAVDRQRGERAGGPSAFPSRALRTSWAWMVPRPDAA